MSEIGDYLGSVLDQVKQGYDNVTDAIGDLTYNIGRGYSADAIRVIQSVVGASQTGVWDLDTLAGLVKWQGSSQRAIKLTPDGRMGPGTLGCMIYELQQAGLLTESRILTRYSYTDPVPRTQKQIVLDLFLSREYVPLLRAVKSLNRWFLHGRFKAKLILHPNLPDPARYEYRQYIQGAATVQEGQWPATIDNLKRSVYNWQTKPGKPKLDAANTFQIPGGLPASWKEDGIREGNSLRKFGYRTSQPVYTNGEEDRYIPFPNGCTYFLTDTYGLEGDRLIDGLRISYQIAWKGTVVDRHNNDRVVYEKVWDEMADEVINIHAAAD